MEVFFPRVERESVRDVNANFALGEKKKMKKNRGLMDTVGMTRWMVCGCGHVRASRTDSQARASEWFERSCGRGRRGGCTWASSSSSTLLLAGQAAGHGDQCGHVREIARGSIALPSRGVSIYVFQLPISTFTS